MSISTAPGSRAVPALCTHPALACCADALHTSSRPLTGGGFPRPWQMFALLVANATLDGDWAREVYSRSESRALSSADAM